jgi:hypothetical protein
LCKGTWARSAQKILTRCLLCRQPRRREPAAARPPENSTPPCAACVGSFYRTLKRTPSQHAAQQAPHVPHSTAGTQVGVG